VKDKYPYIDTSVNSDDSGQMESGVNDRFYAESFSLVDLYYRGVGRKTAGKEMRKTKLHRKMATGCFQI
jgi:hypothetical protein